MAIFSSLATTHNDSSIALACTHTTVPTANAWISVTVAPRSVRERPFPPTQSDAGHRERINANEVGARALGVEERSDETPRARASGAKPAPDPEVRHRSGASSPPSIGCGSLRRRSAVHSPARWVGCFAALYSSHLTAWRKARRKGRFAEEARRKAR